MLATYKSSQELYDDDPDFLEALASIPLTLTQSGSATLRSPNSAASSSTIIERGPREARIDPSSSLALGKRARSPSLGPDEIQHDLSKQHPLSSGAKGNNKDEPFDVYGAASFGGFGEYMVRKRAKLQNQNTSIHQGGAEGSSKPPIFEDVQVYINGYTRPPLQELRTMVLLYGGEFHAYLDRKSLVTHVIAEQLTPAKWKEYANLKVVTPAWIVESVKAQRLLPWRTYQLRRTESLRPDVNASSSVVGSQIDLPSTFASQRPSKPPVVAIAESSTAQSRKGTTTTRPSTLNLLPPSPPKKRNVQDKAFIPRPTSPSPQTNEPSSADGGEDTPASETPKPWAGYAPNASNLKAARLMQDSKWRSENTSAGGASFVEGYFKRSRLHYLSTWKSELKLLVRHARLGERAKLRDGLAHSMRGDELVIGRTSPLKAKPGGSSFEPSTGEKVFMHCDFDSFFVSASLLTRPELRGKPVVVCHATTSGGDENASITAEIIANSTSEIASASYEARAFGVKSGMSLSQAKKLCPELIALPYEFDRYKDFSVKFYNVLLRYADELEVTSVDEAIIDVTSRVLREAVEKVKRGAEFDPVKCVAEQIRDDVRKATSCEISIGIGPNLLLARIATRAAKPAGSFHLRREEAIAHLNDQPLSVLPGFGWSTVEKIKAKWNVTTCGEAREKLKEESAVQKVLGPGTGAKLYAFVRGIDERTLKSDEARKTVSATINYAIRFEDFEQVRLFVLALGKEVAARLEADSLIGRTLTLNIMRRAPDAPIEAPKFLGHGSCDSFSYNAPIYGLDGNATADSNIIAITAWKLVQTHHPGDWADLRGVGISVSSLQSADSITTDKQSKLTFVPKAAGPSRSASDDAGTTAAAKRARETSIDLTGPDSAPTTPTKGRRGHGEPDLAAARRITRQMASRSRTISASPTKQQQYSIFNKRREHTPSLVSDGELHELGIDPDVYRVLPPDIQKEQLNAHRIEARSARSSVGRDSRSRSRSNSAAPRGGGGGGGGAMAGHPFGAPQPPATTTVAHFLVAPALKKARTTEELQDLISRWVESGVDDGPELPAVESFETFLVRCLSQQEILALDKVAGVLKWWAHVCNSRWGPIDLHADSDSESPARRWAEALARVKSAVDAIMVQTYGAPLSLK